ncbi:MAG: UDP-3-O-acyl-N-acetylglucosamine deacetylase [Acidaminococcus sp.]|jgi:UDP-3-O-acyl N-acetylglucosamine deacetylase/beta-hydroxyacyl-ACP dehydratase FabZ|nr:UDP-3-O-acyl-N-acetylglucosamine deacetylase [Acidaminococcus sp.]MCI2099875.1 UDP-3-O-acyl-N-acetylglucosamine deacetylase [Acidaminococcus sp.]MCI2114106.1 UDP-3-O-acyl-N-acetylglucosamine deacetylase [Acidaminococcus sp.]MCI2116046.1 UDP-3-O-acyl-N-acetylglucosamine deacetylase [Acidaminococcus sp.]
MITEKQHTLLGPVSCDGVGLHSGKLVKMTLVPAPVDTGIVFVRTDLDGRPTVKASAENVSDTTRATTLSQNGAKVTTIEHVMAALAILKIDNCYIEMDSAEPPVGDGSAKGFIDPILKVGIKEQEKARCVYDIDHAFSHYDGDRSIVVLPYNGFRITFTSINPHPLLGTQVMDIEDQGDALAKEVGPARTVAFEEEIAQLQKMGLGLGGNLDNVVVFSKDGILSKPRFKDELIRHKILDVIGDMYLLGPIHAHIICMKSGHAFNDNVSRQIAAYRKKQEHKSRHTVCSQEIKTRSKNMITLGIQEIQKILPHRYPMLLVDRIVELEPMKRAVGIKNITFNEPQFMGHFPNNPIMPGVLLIEAMAQVGGVTLLYPEENRGKIAVFGKIDKVRFRRPIKPGDQLVTTAIITKIKGTMGVAHCEGTVDGEPACEGDFFFALTDNK